MRVQSPVVDDSQPEMQVKSKWHGSEHKGKESHAGLGLHRAAVGLDKHLYSMYRIVTSCTSSKTHWSHPSKRNTHRYWRDPPKRWSPTRYVAMPTCSRWAASVDPVFSISHQVKVAPSQSQRLVYLIYPSTSTLLPCFWLWLVKTSQYFHIHIPQTD